MKTDIRIPATMLAKQRRQLTIILAVVLIGLTFVFFLLNLQYRDPVSLIALGSACVFSAGCLILIRFDHARLAAVILCTLAYLAVTASVFDGDGLFDPGIIGYVLLILLSGLLLGRDTVAVSTLGSIAGIVAIGWAQSRELIHPTIRPQDGGNWLPLSLLFVFAGISLWLLMRQLEANTRKVEEFQKSRIEALGTLIRGLAHELNTPLGNSRMVLSLIQDLGDGTISKDQLETLSAAITKSILLVTRLQKFVASAEYAETQTFDLRDKLELVRLRHASEGMNIECCETLPPGNLECRGKWESMETVLTELLTNAFEHDPDGRPRITVDRHGEHMRISVSNGGAPIPASDRGRVFDPFYTTKRSTGHAGLGLYFARYIAVSVLGGWMDMQSTNEDGTKVSFTLPVNQSEV